VDAFHGFPGVLCSIQEVVNVNSTNYQNPLIGFDFPSHFGTQPAVARIYFARIQRAPEGSDHSTTKGGHDIVKRCRVRFGQFGWIHAIVLGNGSMNAEDYWLRFPGQMRDSKRPRPPFNLNVGHVHWIRHFVLSFLHEYSGGLKRRTITVRCQN
jgi:hypothetical protein